MTTSTRKPLLVVADDDPADRGTHRGRARPALRAATTPSAGARPPSSETTLDRGRAPPATTLPSASPAGSAGAELLAGVRARFPAAPARSADPLARLGRSRASASSSCERWRTAGSTSTCSGPRRTSRRGLPPDDLGAPAGVGATEGRRPRRVRRWSRTRGRAAPTSCSRRWPGSAFPTSSSRRRRTPRRRSRSPTARSSSTRRRPSLHEACGFPTELDGGRRRLRRCRRGSGGARRRRLRCVGGAGAPGGDRSGGGDGWSGGNELADPQLPRLPARDQRRGTSRNARTSRPGSSGRSDVLMREVTELARDERRLRRAHRPAAARSRPGQSSSPLGVEYRRLEAPGCVDLEGSRYLLRRVGVGGTGVRRRGRLRGRRRQFGRTGGTPSRPLRRTSTILVRCGVARGEHVAVSDRGDRQHRQPRRPVRDRGRQGTRRGPARAARASGHRDVGGNRDGARPPRSFVLIGAVPHTAWLPDEIARDG